jgi:hypothetical protein
MDINHIPANIFEKLLIRFKDFDGESINEKEIMYKINHYHHNFIRDITEILDLLKKGQVKLSIYKDDDSYYEGKISIRTAELSIKSKKDSNILFAIYLNYDRENIEFKYFPHCDELIVD